VTVFGIVAALIGRKVPSATPIVAYLAVAFAAQVIALRFFIPGLVVKSRLEKMRDESTGSVTKELPGLFQTRMIIGMALLDGAALFNLIAYVINGHWFSLATAGFLLLLMGMMFPTVREFENWAENIERNMNIQF
ncbi:MAG: hypothetical protein WCH39_03200, partial [Schlesneria sp.]